MEDGPLRYPTPSGIIEPISIFKARAEKIDEPRVKVIICQAEVDGLKCNASQQRLWCTTGRRGPSSH